MQAFLLVVHLMLIVALVASVLVQRNEGGLGGLSGGGSGAGGMGGFLSGRTQANLLTRTTAILAAAFFITSLALNYLGNHQNRDRLILPESPVEKSAPVPQVPSGPVAPTGQ